MVRAGSPEHPLFGWLSSKDPFPLCFSSFAYLSSLTGWDKLLRKSEPTKSLGQKRESSWITWRHSLFSFWFTWFLFLHHCTKPASICDYFLHLWNDLKFWLGPFIRTLNHPYTKDKERSLGRRYKVKVIQTGLCYDLILFFIQHIFLHFGLNI